METITKYRTSDGNEYDDKTTAEAHERDLERAETRASMPWIDRYIAGLWDEYAEQEGRAAARHSDLNEGFAKVDDALGSVLMREVDSTNPAWLKTLSDQTLRLHKALTPFYKSVTGLENMLGGMLELRQRISNIEDNRERLLRDNKDVDGTCQWDEGDGHVCDAPTVEGTRWCEEHIDVWCERHDRHALGKRSVSVYTWHAHYMWYPYCEECRN